MIISAFEYKTVKMYTVPKYTAVIHKFIF